MANSNYQHDGAEDEIGKSYVQHILVSWFQLVPVDHCVE